MGFCPVSEMFHKVNGEGGREKEDQGHSGVDEKKNVLDFHDIKASFLDRVYDLLGKGVSMQLVIAFHQDPASVEKWVTNKNTIKQLARLYSQSLLNGMKTWAFLGHHH
ncbi:hypothetical protein NC652_024346 [Populus alba x Populus x berolinensis]|nr:hypothetical protein NC652_024346 [Populus alba x Populus x berolinensis]